MQILGNEKNLAFLKESASSGHLSHAYIINGQRGMGKKTFADNASAALLCKNQKNREVFSPCGYCPSCKRALSKNHPDIIRVVHEKPSTLSVDEVRNQLVRDIDIKPYYGSYKIYIVEDANLMPVQAQNALLKTIEEPPSYAVIFLLTDNSDALLDTIKSRSLKLDMQPLPDSVIKKELAPGGVSAEKSEQICAFVQGNLGLAKLLAENDQAAEEFDFIQNLLSGFKRLDALKIQQAAGTLSEFSFLDVPDTFRKWFRDVLVIKSCNYGRLYFPQQERALSEQARELGYEKINSIFMDIDEASGRLTYNVNAAAVYEALLLRIRRNG